MHLILGLLALDIVIGAAVGPSTPSFLFLVLTSRAPTLVCVGVCDAVKLGALFKASMGIARMRIHV